MSVKVMGAVWELKLTSPKRLVLLAMADHAHDDGSRVFPSTATVAWKTGYSERQTKRIIASLVKDGLLVKERDAAQHVPNLYRINVKAGQVKPPMPDFRGDKLSRLNVSPVSSGVTSDAFRGDILTFRGDTAMSPESSLESSENHQNTDSSNELSPADAGQPDQPKQPYGMVSDHVADADKMVNDPEKSESATNAQSQTDGVLVERIEETPNPVPLTPSPAPKPKRPPQQHIEPLLAWFDVFADIKPQDMNMYATVFCEHGKKQAKSIKDGLLTLEEIAASAHLARAWYDNLAVPNPLNMAWEFGQVVVMQRAFLRAHRQGFTPDDVLSVMQQLKADSWWSGKVIGYAKMIERLPQSRAVKAVDSHDDYSAEWRYQDDSAN